MTADLAAGLRHIADLLDAHPDLPGLTRIIVQAPVYVTTGHRIDDQASVEALIAIAARIGLTVTSSVHKGARHHRAELDLPGVELTLNTVVAP